MAVTITNVQIRDALRLGSTSMETAAAARVGDAARAIVEKLSPDDLPDAVANEMTYRLAGYLFDQPGSAHGSGYSNAWLNSGAKSLLRPWHKATAISIKRAFSEATP